MAGVFIVDTKSDLNLYKQSSYLPQSSCCSGGCGIGSPDAIAELDFNEWIGQLAPSSIPGYRSLTLYQGSFQIYAVKPQMA